MKEEDFKIHVQKIVEKSKELKDRYTDSKDAYANYACIFAQSEEEYNMYIEVAQKLGPVILDTPTGPLFHISPLETVAGVLKLVKVRKPDDKHPELGDADFTVEDYFKFKSIYLGKEGFILMERPNMEMIELMEAGCDVRAYFSHPPLDEELGIK